MFIKIKNTPCCLTDNHRAVVANMHAEVCGFYKKGSTCNIELSLKSTKLNCNHNLHADRAKTRSFFATIPVLFLTSCACQFIAFLTSLFPNTVFLLESLNFHIFSPFLLKVKCTGCVIRVIQFTLAEAFIARPHLLCMYTACPCKITLIHFHLFWPAVVELWQHLQ